MALRPLRLHIPKSTGTPITARRPLSTTSTLSRTITDSARDAVKAIDRVAGNAALKGIETGEAIAETAKQTVSGTTERAREVGGGVAGKAREVGSKARGMKEGMKDDIEAKTGETERRVREAAREGVDI